MVALSGLADRILDITGFIILCKHHNVTPVVLWQEKVNTANQTSVVYNKDMMTFPCEIKNDSSVDRNSITIFQQPVTAVSLSPPSLAQHMGIPLKSVCKTFVQILSTIDFHTSIKNTIGNLVDGATGVHIRGTDKLVQNPNIHEYTKAEFEMYQHKGAMYCAKKAKKGFRKFVIVADDESSKANFIDMLRKFNYNFEFIDLGHIYFDLRADYGLRSIIDLCVLKNCNEIVQITKHSGFSMLASLMGERKLINFALNEKNNSLSTASHAYACCLKTRRCNQSNAHKVVDHYSGKVHWNI